MVLFFHLVTVGNCNLFPYISIALSVAAHANCCRKHRLSCVFLSKSGGSTKKRVSQEFRVSFKLVFFLFFLRGRLLDFSDVVAFTGNFLFGST